MKIPINGSLFSVVEIDGPICRGGKHFPVRIGYAIREIHLLKTLPPGIKQDVLAAAVSEACRVHRVRLIRPRWAGEAKPE